LISFKGVTGNIHVASKCLRFVQLQPIFVGSKWCPTFEEQS
jgi:hypothetical protein